MIFTAFWLGFLVGLFFNDPPKEESTPEILAVREAEEIIAGK